MKKIAFFNHKGGVGKTTLAFNVASALQSLGHRVLLVDADPQCNLTALNLTESHIENLLNDSEAEEEDEDGGATIWTGLRPVVRGRGGLGPVTVWGDNAEPIIIAGDVLLADYEEELYSVWNECYAGKPRAFDVTCALASLVNSKAQEYGCDVVFYDVGPNVGALNRVVLLDSDYFITPVAPDLFSLRALSTVGRKLVDWLKAWKDIRSRVKGDEKKRLFTGNPKYLGYVISAFKVYNRQSAEKADPHEYWENRIASRVKHKLVDPLIAENFAHLLQTQYPYKLGEVAHYQSLAAAAQKELVPIGQLQGKVNPGHAGRIDAAKKDFAALAAEIHRRADL